MDDKTAAVDQRLRVLSMTYKELPILD